LLILRAIRLAGAMAFVWVASSRALAATVVLHEMDPGTTSPTGVYRWLDVADQAYSDSYRSAYSYAQASVQVTYQVMGGVLCGTLTASNLKPNFTYQLKLLGTPGTPANERIGLTGRWWQQVWTGSAWSVGQNLNDKGDGSSPNPNDRTYFATRDIPDASSPTGRHYRYTAYLVMDYFITHELGNAALSFAADSSYHVLWKASQRARTDQDGPLKETTFDPDPSAHPAYDVDYSTNTVSIFGEWERLPVGGVCLPLGDYPCQMMLTEESFHGSGGTYAGGWAAAMAGDVSFIIGHRLHVQSSPISGVRITGTPAGITDYSSLRTTGSAVRLSAPSTVARPGRTYYFVRWTLNGVKRAAGARVLAFTINRHSAAVAVYKTVKCLRIRGPTAVMEQSRARYRCWAFYSDGSSRDVTAAATWREHSVYVRFEGPGLLRTFSVGSDKTCSIGASYGGKRRHLDIRIRKR
jgi:hypothetical protein